MRNFLLSILTLCFLGTTFSEAQPAQPLPSGVTRVEETPQTQALLQTLLRAAADKGVKLICDPQTVYKIESMPGGQQYAAALGFLKPLVDSRHWKFLGGGLMGSGWVGIFDPNPTDPTIYGVAGMLEDGGYDYAWLTICRSVQ